MLQTAYNPLLLTAHCPKRPLQMFKLLSLSYSEDIFLPISEKKKKKIGLAWNTYSRQLRTWLSSNRYSMVQGWLF